MEEWLDVYTVLTILSFLSLLLGFVSGGWCFHALPKYQQKFVFYLGLALAVELLSNALGKRGFNNLILYPLYVSGEFFYLMQMFLIRFNKAKWVVGLRIVVVFFLGVVLLFPELFAWIDYAKVVSHIVIIAFSGYYLVSVLGKKEFDKRSLWLIGAVFFYFTSSVLLFMLFPQVQQMTPEQAAMLWSLNALLNLILYGVSAKYLLRLKKSY